MDWKKNLWEKVCLSQNCREDIIGKHGEFMDIRKVEAWFLNLRIVVIGWSRPYLEG